MKTSGVLRIELKSRKSLTGFVIYSHVTTDQLNENYQWKIPRFHGNSDCERESSWQLVTTEKLNLVPRVSRLNAPGGGKMRDPQSEVGQIFSAEEYRGRCCKDSEIKTVSRDPSH